MLLLKIKLILLLLAISFSLSAQQIPDGFVYLKEEIPSLLINLRYASSENFTGKIVPGYNSSKAIGTKELATALKKVQAKLKDNGLGLKIFDAYRPQSAVNSFMSWSESYSDTLRKQEYYPNINKKSLFELGYIAEKSGHTRGSTVDITLIHLVGINKGKELDMGGNWDFFGERSHFNFTKITPEQKQNRELLQKVMTREGFSPYKKEWWHFSLKNEPFPETYFDFTEY